MRSFLAVAGRSSVLLVAASFFGAGFDENLVFRTEKMSSEASRCSWHFTQKDFSDILFGTIAFQLARFMGPSICHVFFGIRPYGRAGGPGGGGGRKPPGIGGGGGPPMPGIGGGGGPPPMPGIGGGGGAPPMPGIGGGGGGAPPMPGIGGGGGGGGGPPPPIPCGLGGPPGKGGGGGMDICGNLEPPPPLGITPVASNCLIFSSKLATFASASCFSDSRCSSFLSYSSIRTASFALDFSTKSSNNTAVSM